MPTICMYLLLLTATNIHLVRGGAPEGMTKHDADEEVAMAPTAFDEAADTMVANFAQFTTQLVL